MPVKPEPPRPAKAASSRPAEVLDVRGTAALLTVSADTVYDLFAKGDLPGRTVGRKWITTRTAVLRWIETTVSGDTLTRAIRGGDVNALTRAMNDGKARVRRKEG